MTAEDTPMDMNVKLREIGNAEKQYLDKPSAATWKKLEQRIMETYDDQNKLNAFMTHYGKERLSILLRGQ